MDTLTSSVRILQQLEISINQIVQQTFQPIEPVWINLSEYFSAAQLIDVVVPLVGTFHHQLLVRLVCSLAVINTFNSLVKWANPEYRPYWWIREFPEAHNISTLHQSHLTCETTAGFPSSHAMAFTTFIQLLTVFFFSSCFRYFRCNIKHLEYLCVGVVGLSSVCMWLSRLYLGCQFLHQCVMGTLAAVLLLHIFDSYSTFFYTMSLRTSVALVILFGTLPFGVYFGMLQLDMDPHWSVRMAFKWCSDVNYLRHEASPIFILGRDFGYLMGVAVSAPLYRRFECNINLVKRIPAVAMLELVNWYARQEVPKQRGRFIFVAYEFFRNAFHSYFLLSVISKIS